jgi:hypothetical protein
MTNGEHSTPADEINSVKVTRNAKWKGYKTPWAASYNGVSGGHRHWVALFAMQSYNGMNVAEIQKGISKL